MLPKSGRRSRAPFGQSSPESWTDDAGVVAGTGIRVRAQAGSVQGRCRSRATGLRTEQQSLPADPRYDSADRVASRYDRYLAELDG